MSNADVFENFTNNERLYFNRNELEDGSIVFSAMNQRLDSVDCTCDFLVFFDPEDSIVQVQICFTKINNPLRKDAAYKLINELNDQYRYTKFKINSDIVSANYAFLFLDNSFSPSDVLTMMRLLTSSVVEAYPQFMKLMWG